MVILFVSDLSRFQTNGVVTTMRNIEIELEKLGHQVVHFNVDSCDFKFTVPFYKDIKLAFPSQGRVKHILRHVRPDFIHIVTEGPIGRAFARYLTKHDIKYTTSYHTRFDLYLKKYLWIPESLTNKILRSFHQRAVTTFVTTESMKEILDYPNAVVMSRGIDHNMFNTNIDPQVRRSIRSAVYHVDDDDTIVLLYCGRIAREKSVEDFLHLNIPNTVLVCVGDGPMLKSYQQHFPDVRFVGRVEQKYLRGCYCAADIFVFPSYTDTFGIVMLEALACGLPIVAPPISGPIDIVNDNIGNIATWSLQRNAVDLIQRFKNNRAEIVENCLNAAQRYSWERVAKTFLANLAPQKDSQWIKLLMS